MLVSAASPQKPLLLIVIALHFPVCKVSLLFVHQPLVSIRILLRPSATSSMLLIVGIINFSGMQV